MNRISGFLDLNEIDSFLIENSVYSNDHYWVEINNEEYYYKITNFPYHEVVCSELGKQMGLDIAEYDLATYRGNFGVISKSYHKPRAEYIPGYEVLYNYWKSSKKIVRDMGLKRIDWRKTFIGPEYVYMNNLETIWQALEYLYGNKYPKDQIFACFFSIVEEFIFCILTGQYDKSSHNWELEITKDKMVKVPIYDNEASFPSEEHKVTFSVGMKDSLHNMSEVLHNFLRYSSSEYIELFLEMYNKSSREVFDGVIASIERQTQCEIPLRVKEELVDNYETNRQIIQGVLVELNLIDQLEK